MSIKLSPFSKFFVALYVSFPEPAGIIPNLFFVPTSAGNVIVNVPSPPTT